MNEGRKATEVGGSIRTWPGYRKQEKHPAAGKSFRSFMVCFSFQSRHKNSKA